MSNGDDQTREMRVIAVVMAGVGLVWITLRALEDSLGWSQRTGGLIDLAALAGFAWALWLLFGFWRRSQKDKD